MSTSDLQSLLKEVSRSFYLTLRILPGCIRRQIGLAYLLARTTDTISDTGLVAVDQRLKALQAMRERVSGASRSVLNFCELARHQGTPAERVLLEQCEQILETLNSLALADLELVREVLGTIISGQELDLRRFDGASAERLVALQTDVELDDYTYRVAGCVGEFWTKVCREQLFPKAQLDDVLLITSGVRFGKGLQLVNILRDLPVDLRQGRCYLPRERLAAAGLKPEDLLEPANEPGFRRLYHDYLDKAEAHLRAGWLYTNTLPRGCVRVRLACAWPIQIGLETLRLLRTSNVLDPEHRVKVSRRRVKQLMLRSVVAYPRPAAWRKLVSFPIPEAVSSGQGDH